MAGDHDGEGVVRQRPAHGARPSGHPKVAGKQAVCGHLAARNPLVGQEHAALEG